MEEAENLWNIYKSLSRAQKYAEKSKNIPIASAIDLVLIVVRLRVKRLIRNENFVLN